MPNRRSLSPRFAAACVAAAAGLFSPAGPAVAQGHTPTPTQRLLGWWEDYARAASGSTSPTTPPIARRFLNARLAPGMSEEVRAEYDALTAGAPPPRPPFALGDCRAGGVQVLATSGDPPSAAICVAPLVISSLYFQCVGTDLERLKSALNRYGLTPAQGMGRYEPAYGSRGITAGDWAAMTSVANDAWRCFQGSVDFVLARQIAAVGQRPDGTDAQETQLQARADQLAAQAGRSPHKAALLAVLIRAEENYDPATWGYSAAKDLDPVMRTLHEAGRTLTRPTN